jgi:predicted nucleic acid-binding protein
VSYTIDASVFVSDVVTAEIHHTDSQAFLNALRLRSEQVYCPTLLLVEAVAAIARPTGNIALAQSELGVIRHFPRMKLVNLTIARARRAAQLAAVHRLRGADAVYLAVAAEYGTTLITWVTEMLMRGASIVTTMTPADWLSSPPPP